MSDDNDDTPRYQRAAQRPRAYWDDERRAEHGAEYRRGDRQRSSAEIAVPEPLEKGASAGYRVPDFDLLKELELTGPTDQVMADPVAREVWEHFERTLGRFHQIFEWRRRKTTDHVLQVAQSAGPQAVSELRAEVDGLKRSRTALYVLIGTAIAAAGGSLGAVGSGLYNRGAREGGDAIRLDHLEHRLDRIDDEIERMNRHSSLLPTKLQPASTALTSVKGSPP